jgi:hypothetical protein
LLQKSVFLDQGLLSAEDAAPTGEVSANQNGLITRWYSAHKAGTGKDQNPIGVPGGQPEIVLGVAGVFRTIIPAGA